MLLDPVQGLIGPGQAVEKQSAVLIRNRRLEAFGDENEVFGMLALLLCLFISSVNGLSESILSNTLCGIRDLSIET